MKKTTKTVAEKWLIIPDLHVPAHDEKSLAAVEMYMGDHDWDGVLYLGDFLDMNVVSAHNKNNLRAVNGQTLAKEYAFGNKILDRHMMLCPRTKFVMLEGNHEFRVTRYIDARPEMEGLCEVPIGLKLAERNIEWVPSWSLGEVYTIGKANFSHGFYHCKNHSRKTSDNFGGNLFYGHTHDVESSGKTFYGENTTMIAQSLGCLIKYNQSYMRGLPSNWQQLICPFYFRADGYFNHYPCFIFDHAFTSPEGVFYDGKI